MAKKTTKPREIWHIHADRRSRLESGDWLFDPDADYFCGQFAQRKDGTWALGGLTKRLDGSHECGVVRFPNREEMVAFIEGYYGATLVKGKASWLPRPD